MGFDSIVFASLSVAFGTYILSSALSGEAAFINFLIYKPSKLQVAGIGLSLNLLGSAFWILGRRFLSSYLLAWSLYLGFLVLFGAVISILIEHETISLSQIIGLILLASGLILLTT